MDVGITDTYYNTQETTIMNYSHIDGDGAGSVFFHIKDREEKFSLMHITVHV